MTQQQPPTRRYVLALVANTVIATTCAVVAIAAAVAGHEFFPVPQINYTLALAGVACLAIGFSFGAQHYASELLSTTPSNAPNPQGADQA